MKHIEKLATSVYGVVANIAKCAHLEWSAEQTVATDADGVMTSTAGATSIKTITDDLVSPPTPRCLEVVVGGEGGDAKATTKIKVFGTNIADQPITEEFTLTGDKTETITGTKAFKTVGKVEIPAQDGTGVTFTVGWIDALGLPYALAEKPLVFALVAGVREETDPALAIDEDEIEKNTITLDTALAGAKIDLYMFL